MKQLSGHLVGDQVWYYSRNTFWAESILDRSAPAPESEKKMAREFIGPFAATIVFVHQDGSMNLLILFPSPCYGSADKTQLVEKVPFSEAAVGSFADPRNPPGFWSYRRSP